jgi:hypothetical protein
LDERRELPGEELALVFRGSTKCSATHRSRRSLGYLTERPTTYGGPVPWYRQLMSDPGATLSSSATASVVRRLIG